MISAAESITATAFHLADAFGIDSNPAFKQMVVSDADQGENKWPYPNEGQCYFFLKDNLDGDNFDISFDTGKCGKSPYSFEIGSHDEQKTYDLATEQYYFDNEVSSWACGKGVAIDFCKDGVSHSCTGDKKRSAAGPIKSKMIGD